MHVHMYMNLISKMVSKCFVKMSKKHQGIPTGWKDRRGKALSSNYTQGWKVI